MAAMPASSAAAAMRQSKLARAEGVWSERSFWRARRIEHADAGEFAGRRAAARRRNLWL